MQGFLLMAGGARGSEGGSEMANKIKDDAAGAAPDQEKVKDPERYIGNLLLPTTILALAGICLVQTFDFPGGGEDVGPAGVPYLWIGFTALFCVMLIIQVILRKMPPDPIPGRIGFVILFAGWLAVYLIAIENIGYYVSTFIFLMVSMYVLTYRNYLIMLTVSVGWLVFAYLVFAQLLFIQLPEGPLFRLLFE